jgi:ADP-ribosyl-[dinitrogen reductase] hydrolase
VCDLTFAQTDRGIGALVGLAGGDALGAGCEFEPRVPYTRPLTMSGGGAFRWAPGGWTDDTSMAYAIAEVAAAGADLRSDDALDRIAQRWWTWAQDATDIGVQTSSVLRAARADGTAKGLRAAAEKHHVLSGSHAGGNGSLMRTAPVALAYLGPNQDEALWQAADAISALTHWEQDAREACGLWCLAIRHAVLHGDFEGLRLAVERLPADRRMLWSARLDEAEAHQPWWFPNNGKVVAALQAAWSAIVNTAVPAEFPAAGVFAAQHAEHAIERAARCGGDTDTVAAIAGALVGARWGASAIPAEWKLMLHGWNRATTADLVRLAVMTMRGGEPTSCGWPIAPTVDAGMWPERFAFGVMSQHPNLLLAGQAALQDRIGQFTKVVSLSRVGTVEGGMAAGDHLKVMVLDSAAPADNPNLAFLMWDTARQMEQWLTAGERVLLHCVQAQNRTPSFAAAYLMSAKGLTTAAALNAVQAALPQAFPHGPFVAALRALEGKRGGELRRVRDGERIAELWMVVGDVALQRRGAGWVAGELPTVTEAADGRDTAEFDEAEMAGGVMQAQALPPSALPRRLAPAG